MAKACKPLVDVCLFLGTAPIFPGPWYPLLRSEAKTVSWPFLWESPRLCFWAQRKRVDIKLHSSNQQATGSRGTGWEAMCSWPDSLKSPFTRGTACAQEYALSPVSPLHSRAGWGASVEASASFAFLALILVLPFFQSQFHISVEVIKVFPL